ncbi:MAG: asparagine synthase (glutamine-hydrolyzing) [Sedimentisphaerales bacterium]|nr:asparagine synthase (glutamine-hydrolyzing) [Sedimentisphaerales bacterium]
MCGFTGTFQGLVPKVQTMPPLLHRGPDSTGQIRQNDLYMRHWRLAILGEEPAAHQPMVSDDESVVLVFNGEIYNYREIAEQMGQTNLSDYGDTRVLVEFLARYHLSRLDMLNGMFAIAVWFRKEDRLYLIRDRFGIKPLYYALADGGIYFASEIKCFSGLFDLHLDPQRIAEYLDGGRYPSGEHTFYEHVRQVRPSHWIQFDRCGIQDRCYYDLMQTCRDLMECPLSVEEYEHRFAESVRLRLRSDVPISLHYSGGADSTAVLLKTKEVWGWNYPLVTYTMAYHDQQFDESCFVQDYCRRIGVENHKVFLTPEEVPALAERLHLFEDEPFGGIPVISYYKMNQVQRTNGTIVSIEGQGGDETFGGYLSHAYMAMYDLYRSGREPELLDKLLLSCCTDIHTVVTTAEALVASGFQAHMDLTDMRIGSTSSAGKEIDWLRTIQRHDILVNKIPRTLRFHDRASMACGREVRFPLLDHNVLTYGLAFDHKTKYADGLNKAPLRAIVRRHLPGVYDIPKRSVVTPQTAWFHNELKDWVWDRVGVLQRAGILEPRYFDRFERFYRDEETGNSFYIWQLVNLSFYCDLPIRHSNSLTTSCTSLES